MTSPTRPVVVLHDVSKAYETGSGTVPVLTDVSLEIAPAEFVTIMGPSGCGKSTLLHLISGLDKQSSGYIEVDGQAISDLTSHRMTLLRRDKIGFIFQFFNLLPHLTVRENIALPALITGADDDDSDPVIDDLMNWIGVTQRAGHFPGQLSGGEMQRVSIARALANSPAIVLADEPTGNVSTRVGEEIMKLLRDRVNHQGQTILLVTHNPHDAARGDRVLFLKDGCIHHEHTLTGSDVHESRIFASLQELGI